MSILLLVTFEKIKPEKKVLKITVYILNVLFLTLSFLYAFVCLKEALERENKIYAITVLTSFLIIVIGIVIMLSIKLKATTTNNRL